MDFNPEPDTAICAGDKLVVLGRPNPLKRLEAEAARCQKDRLTVDVRRRNVETVTPICICLASETEVGNTHCCGRNGRVICPRCYAATQRRPLLCKGRCRNQSGQQTRSSN